LFCAVEIHIKEKISRCKETGQRALNFFKKCDEEAWTGLIWLRIRTGGGYL
jgi:hypothetical protein